MDKLNDNFERALLNYKNQIDAALKTLSDAECPETLRNAMSYSLFAGGKRLRPVLLLAACEASGGSIDAALPFACAIEMIHTYSLIHDDLPAMDDDDFRRGKPTNHKVFGEAIAILAGDGLLNLAYEVMTRACKAQACSNTLAAMAEIACAAGVCGMIGGQAVDILLENKNVTEDILLYMHQHKTAALIKASLKAGALLGGASMETMDALERGGISLGIAFQIKDDILDVTSTQKMLGKPVHSDSKNNKTTYVSVHGLEKAGKDYEVLSRDAITLLESAFPVQSGETFPVTYAKRLFKRDM